MKSIKYYVISAFLALSIVGGGIYVSCTKDGCRTVNCLNGCTCGGGICNNPPKGVGGLNCEIIYRDLYKNNIYKGSGVSDSSKWYIDNLLTFTANNDTNFTQMEVAWNNYGPHLINMTITLSKNSATGSTFTVTQTPIDSFIYTGTGFVNNTTASLDLTEFHIRDSTTRIIKLENFVKQ